MRYIITANRNDKTLRRLLVCRRFAPLVVGFHGPKARKAVYAPVNDSGSCWFSRATKQESCQWSGKRPRRLLVGGVRPTIALRGACVKIKGGSPGRAAAKRRWVTAEQGRAAAKRRWVTAEQGRAAASRPPAGNTTPGPMQQFNSP